jgi:hypothetical protein
MPEGRAATEIAGADSHAKRGIGFRQRKNKMLEGRYCATNHSAIAMMWRFLVYHVNMDILFNTGRKCDRPELDRLFPHGGEREFAFSSVAALALVYKSAVDDRIRR